VVIEIDSKYHKKHNQKKADLIRQNKIINILKPKVFWIYDSVNNKVSEVYRQTYNKQKK